MKQVKRAFTISNSEIQLNFDSEDDISFTVKRFDGKSYDVTAVEGIWRCNCEDYVYAKNKELGSYNCKHILKCIMFLYSENFAKQTTLDQYNGGSDYNG